MAKTASLTSGLVAKGQAAPAVPLLVEAPKPAAFKTTAPDYYKSLTVKLNRERYEALKTLGMKLDKKSQEIFVEALDLYLKQTAHSA